MKLKYFRRKKILSTLLFSKIWKNAKGFFNFFCQNACLLPLDAIIFAHAQKENAFVTLSKRY
jgi:hypothetical protein